MSVIHQASCIEVRGASVAAAPEVLDAKDHLRASLPGSMQHFDPWASQAPGLKHFSGMAALTAFTADQFPWNPRGSSLAM